MDVLYVAGLIEAIGLVTTASTERMTTENNFLLTPKSRGPYPNGTLVRGCGVSGRWRRRGSGRRPHSERDRGSCT